MQSISAQKQFDKLKITKLSSRVLTKLYKAANLEIIGEIETNFFENLLPKNLCNAMVNGCTLGH